MMSLIQTIGSFIQWIYFNVTVIFDTVISVLAWVSDQVLTFKIMIGSVCPTQISLLIIPVLVSMFTFLGIKLLVRLL